MINELTMNVIYSYFLRKTIGRVSPTAGCGIKICVKYGDVLRFKIL